MSSLQSTLWMVITFQILSVVVSSSAEHEPSDAELMRNIEAMLETIISDTPDPASTSTPGKSVHSLSNGDPQSTTEEVNQQLVALLEQFGVSLPGVTDASTQTAIPCTQSSEVELAIQKVMTGSLQSENQKLCQQLKKKDEIDLMSEQRNAFQVEEIQRQNDVIERLQSDLDQHAEVVLKSAEQVAELKDDARRHQTFVVKLQREQADCERNMMALMLRTNALQSQRDSEFVSNSALRSENEELRKRIKIMEREMTRKPQSVSSLDSRIERLIEEKEAFRNLAEATEERVQENQRKIIQLEAEKVDLEGCIEDMTEGNKISKEVNPDHLLDALERIDSLESENEKLKDEKVGLGDCIGDLTRENKMLKEEKAKRQTDKRCIHPLHPSQQIINLEFENETLKGEVKWMKYIQKRAGISDQSDDLLAAERVGGLDKEVQEQRSLIGKLEEEKAGIGKEWLNALKKIVSLESKNEKLESNINEMKSPQSRIGISDRAVQANLVDAERVGRLENEVEEQRRLIGHLGDDNEDLCELFDLERTAYVVENEVVRKQRTLICEVQKENGSRFFKNTYIFADLPLVVSQHVPVATGQVSCWSYRIPVDTAGAVWNRKLSN